MFVDSPVMSGRMIGKSAQVSWIDVLQILFYFGLVDRVCYASICNALADIGVWMLLIYHVCCVLNCHQNSRSVPTDTRTQSYLPITSYPQSLQSVSYRHMSWRHGSTTRVTRTCCGNRLSVHNRADTLRNSYESQLDHETPCSLITKHNTSENSHFTLISVC
jgi:hypothetical protein